MGACHYGGIIVYNGIYAHYGGIILFYGGLIIIPPLYQYIPLAFPSAPQRSRLLATSKSCGEPKAAPSQQEHLRTLTDNFFLKHLDMKNTVLEKHIIVPWKTNYDSSIQEDTKRTMIGNWSFSLNRIFTSYFDHFDHFDHGFLST